MTVTTVTGLNDSHSVTQLNGRYKVTQLSDSHSMTQLNDSDKVTESINDMGTEAPNDSLTGLVPDTSRETG